MAINISSIGLLPSPDVTAEIREHSFAALGIGSRILEVGQEGAEEAVVFLHGHPGSADDWRDLLSRVAPFARAVAIDLPGFGKAEKSKVLDYTPGTYGIFIAAALAELGIRRAHLVMHDLGGMGVIWGVSHPENFASAVLIDTGILVDFRWHPVARLYRTRGIGEVGSLLTNRAGFRAVMKLYNPQPRKLPAEVIDRWWADYSLRTRLAALNMYRTTPEELMGRLVEPMRRLDRPALVLWGAHDPAVPQVQAERQLRSFPSAEVVVLPDSGHWPYLDDPDGAAAAIIPFLQRQLGQTQDSIPEEAVTANS